LATATLEKTETKKFTVSVDPQSYLTFTFIGMSLKFPIGDKTIADVHDSTQSFFEDLMSIPGVKSVFEKHGVIVEKTIKYP